MGYLEKAEKFLADQNDGKKQHENSYPTLITRAPIEVPENGNAEPAEGFGVPTKKERHLIKRGIYIQCEQDRIADRIEALTKRHDEIMRGSAETERQLYYEFTKGERESGINGLTGSPLRPKQKGYRTRELNKLKGKQSPIFDELYDIVCNLEILNEHSAKLGQEADKLVKEIREYLKKDKQSEEELAKPMTGIKEFLRLLCEQYPTGSKNLEIH